MIVQLKTVAEDVIFAKKFLVNFTEFTCHGTNRKYKKRSILNCNTKSIMYWIVYKCCSKQCIGSATGFKKILQLRKVILIPVRLAME